MTPKALLAEIERRFELPADLKKSISSLLHTGRPTPRYCPLCKRELARWQQTIRTVRRGGGTTSHVRPHYVCKTCKVSVVLHRRLNSLQEEK